MRTMFKSQRDKDKYEKALEDRLNSLEKRRSDHASKKISDITVNISQSSESESTYKISVKNSGKSTYENIRIRYEPILLWADCFGLDTTHMPLVHQSTKGEPIIIEVLSPTSTIEFIRKGYGKHTEYDGPKETEVYLLAPAENFEGCPLNNFNWCKASIDLPMAKGSRNI